MSRTITDATLINSGLWHTRKVKAASATGATASASGWASNDLAAKLSPPAASSSASAAPIRRRQERRHRARLDVIRPGGRQGRVRQRQPPREHRDPAGIWCIRAEDVEELVPEGLAFGGFARFAPPFLADGDGAVADLVPRLRHGRRVTWGVAPKREKSVPLL